MWKLALCVAVLVCLVWPVFPHDHRRGEGEGEGERHRHHHHGVHGEGEGETGHDHSDHGGGKHGPWYCDSRHRYLKVAHNKFTIGKKRLRDNDVTAEFTLQSIIEKNAAGNQVVGSGVVGVYHTHTYDFNECNEDNGCVMFGELDRYDKYQGLPVCHITVTYVLSRDWDVRTTIDFYFFKGEGIISDGPRRARSFYEVNSGSVKMEIRQREWKFCSASKQNCVIKARHTKTYDVGAYLDFSMAAVTPTAGIQSPDDDTLWYVGGGGYMYIPHRVRIDDDSWASQLHTMPQFAMPTLTHHLPPFKRSLEWGWLLTFAEPLSGWRPGGPTGPPTNPPTVSSSSAAPAPVVVSSSSGVAVVPVAPSSSSAVAPIVASSSTGVSTPPTEESSTAPDGMMNPGPPGPPTPPCSGSLCGSGSTGGAGGGSGDPTDDPDYNPWPSTPSSSTGAPESGTTGGTGEGAQSSTGGSEPPAQTVLECLVAEWAGWSGCDVACGMGSQTRMRDVTQLPRGGPVCPEIFQIRECDPEPPACAAADCAPGPWGYWSVCSGACGRQNRTRDIVTAESVGGLPCPELFESRQCRQLECLTPVTPVSPETPAGAGSTGAPTVLGSTFAFNPNSANGWWIALVVLGWIAVILGVNEYITRLWDRPSPVGVGAVPGGEAEQLVPH